jgi:predicted RNase H-like HicB family nuclease
MGMAFVPVGVSLTAVFEPVEDGWTQARIEELPEVVTAGPSLAEAKLLLADALREYLLSLAQDSEPLPVQGSAVRERFRLDLVGLSS